MRASRRSTVVKGRESESAKSRCDRAWCGQKLQSRGPRRVGEGLLAERWGNRWWWKGVRRRRRRDACMHTRTHLVSWPGALAGPGAQECAVVCGWDPPLSAPACPPSPHTSRLFILHCGKITVPAASYGSCKVYVPHPRMHVHTTVLPNSLSHKQLWGKLAY